MSPTVTIDTDSDPGSWARHSALSDLARVKVLFQARAIAAVIGTTPPAPTCARCRTVLCGCADHHWKG